MKKRTISLLCGLLATACSPELHDENSVLENNRQQAEMSVEVQVSGTMISTRSAASAEERAVTSYDIYIFDVTTNALQYCKQGIVPAEPEKIAGTHNYRIGSEQIVLPTSGQKHVFVLGNAGGSVTLPTLVTLDEATESAPATALDDFRSSVVVTPAGPKAPAAPFVMAGTTFIASAANAHVPVCLAGPSPKYRSATRFRRDRPLGCLRFGSLGERLSFRKDHFGRSADRRLHRSRRSSLPARRPGLSTCCRRQPTKRPSR